MSLVYGRMELSGVMPMDGEECWMDGMGWDGMGWDRMGWDGAMNGWKWCVRAARVRQLH
jgi:hypothetical protein